MKSLKNDCLDSKPAAAIGAARQSRSTGRDSLLILFVGATAFTFALTPEFINLDARFALFAQEMLRNGPSFFPTIYHVPYPDYPAASTFLIYLVSLPFGRVTPFTAVLPTAVVSALILVVTYRIGAIHSRRWGLAAVLLALFTVEFFATSRSIALDQYTSLAATLSFYIAYSSDCLGRRRRLWLLPLVWALDFIFRGPVGLVVPAGVSCAYYFWNTRFKQMLLVGNVAGGMLIVCLAGLLLAARAQGGAPFMKRVLDAQMTGRLGDRGAGFAYYWYRSLIPYAASYPLAIIVVAATFSLGKMVRDNELVAIIASGVSAQRIGAPILGMALLFTGLWVADQELLIPALGNKLARGHGDVPGEEYYEAWFIRDGNGSLICAPRFYLKTATFDRPVMITRRPTDRPGIWAVTGRIAGDKAVFNKETGRWDLVNGSFVSTEAKDPPRPLRSYDAPGLMPKDVPVVCESEYKSLFSSRQLSILAARKANIRDIAKLYSQRPFRITEPLINLTMLMVSLPVLICRDPRAMKSAIIVSFSLTAACFVTLFVCKMLATEVIFAQRVMPELWAWLPVFIFVPIAFVELDAMRT